MWEYNGKEITDNDVIQYVGFVYIITNILNQRKYIGKKLLNRTKIYHKNKKKKKIKISSNWKIYYGSSKILLDDVNKYGKKNFKREIIHFCKNKSEMSYLEAMEQFKNNVLLSENYYNDWIFVKVRKINLKSMIRK